MIFTNLLALASTASYIFSVNAEAGIKSGTIEGFNKCLGVDQYHDLYLFECDGHDDQIWHFEGYWSVGYNIKNEYYPDMCLTANEEWNFDVRDVQTQTVQFPQLMPCTDAANQKWAIGGNRADAKNSLYLYDNEIDWHDITSSDVRKPYSNNVDLVLLDDEDGHLIVDGTLKKRGCGDGESNAFSVLVEPFDDKPWHFIEYTMEFVEGSSSCWSILGNTHYGEFLGDNLGLHKFDIDEGDIVIFNELSFGDWQGETIRCDNELDNFLNGKHGHGYKGSIRVRQRRDFNEVRGYIGSGYSCTKIGTIVRYKDIRVGYLNNDDHENSECLMPFNGGNGDRVLVQECGDNSWKWDIDTSV